jgi:hypothetical protein
MLTVHVIKLDSTGTDSLLKGELLQGNSNLLPNNPLPGSSTVTPPEAAKQNLAEDHRTR